LLAALLLLDVDGEPMRRGEKAGGGRGKKSIWRRASEASVQQLIHLSTPTVKMTTGMFVALLMILFENNTNFLKLTDPHLTRYAYLRLHSASLQPTGTNMI
jgi:hypothetical protein